MDNTWAWGFMKMNPQFLKDYDESKEMHSKNSAVVILNIVQQSYKKLIEGYWIVQRQIILMVKKN